MCNACTLGDLKYSLMTALNQSGWLQVTRSEINTNKCYVYYVQLQLGIKPETRISPETQLPKGVTEAVTDVSSISDSGKYEIESVIYLAYKVFINAEQI